MVSVLGLLEAKETTAREVIERLREEADRVPAELGEAEGRLERLVIARETVGEVLNGPAVPAREATVKDADTVPAGVMVVPRRREGLSPRVLPEEYQRVMALLEAGAAAGGVRARDLTVALGREAVPAKIECVRSTAKRLVARGWAVEATPGVFAPAVGQQRLRLLRERGCRARRRPMTMVMDHMTIVSWVAGRRS
ncbi:hypothetical protein OG239_02775 [Streptomyces sp. NBC_00868]|uniref:hypothetical protein n=1 Tax=unclassified Streptomyces TaxID=2593676 RepID=UPI0032520177|nr:hypothetical protein OG239_02775 [Streptomyces sp. NBC_00868]